MLRGATPADLELLVAMMGDYYQEVDSRFDAHSARRAMGELSESPALGRLWLIEPEREPCGYLALTFGFSLELGGRDAFLDDLYVKPAHRSRGLATAAIQAALGEARALGIRAVHLEVDHRNDKARALYRRLGFGERDRYFLMCHRMEDLPGARD